MHLYIEVLLEYGIMIAVKKIEACLAFLAAVEKRKGWNKKHIKAKWVEGNTTDTFSRTYCNLLYKNS